MARGRLIALSEGEGRAMSGEIKWVRPAQILGISARQMRRWKRRYERHGYDGLFDRRRRIPFATAQEVLRLYRDEYAGFNVRHFHEEITEKEGVSTTPHWPWLTWSLLAMDCVLHTVHALSFTRP